MIHIVDEFNTVDLSNPTQYQLSIYEGIDEIRELDNNGYEIHRPLFSHSSLPDILDMENVSSNDIDMYDEFIYTVHVHHNQKLWVEHIDLIPEYILDAVRDRRCYLIFDGMLEGNRVDGEWLIDPLYSNLTKLQIPFDMVCFITNNLLAEEVHNKWYLDQEVYSEKIKIISFMYNVYDIKRLQLEGHLPSSVSYDQIFKYKVENLDKIKLFMKVNRTNRWERDVFALFIRKYSIDHKSLISYPKFVNDFHPSEFDYLYSEDNLKSLMQYVPYDLDDTDVWNKGEPGVGKGFFNADLPFNPIHYLNSFISIVLSPFPFEENACHIHSSFYNPIYCGHPIIHFGPVGTFDIIKSNGFETYSKWFDESYDSISDGVKRLSHVMNVVKDLSKISNDEFIKIYKDMKDVIHHNINLIETIDLKKQLIDKIFL